MKAHELTLALQKRFSPPEHVFLPQVRDSVGFEARTTADALAMSVWPSRGLHLHGFEIKVSRSDWLRELKKPAKAENICQYCHFWWIVVPEGIKIVDRIELPPTWGLMTCSSKGLKIEQPAPMLTPKEWNVGFVGSILRAAQQVVVPRAQIQNEINEASKKEYERGLETGKRQAGRDSEKLADLQRTVAKFEEASGIKLANSWNAGNIGKAVSAVMNVGPDEIERQLKAYRRQVENILNQIDTCMTGLREEST